jgi:prophage regulatory protein
MVAAVHHLVGAQEIARMFGVSRQRAYQITRRPDFPAPVAVLGLGSVWHTDEVKDWAAKHRKAD